MHDKTTMQAKIIVGTLGRDYGSLADTDGNGASSKRPIGDADAVGGPHDVGG